MQNYFVSPFNYTAVSSQDLAKSIKILLIQVRYRIDPHMQNSMRKLKLTLTLYPITLTLTLTDTGGAVLTLMLGYRSLYIT